MLTQIELEKEMAPFGRAKAYKTMQRNEAAGSADNNPYAKAIYRRYVMPLAELIRDDVTTKRPGRNKAHVTLLEPLDPEAIAYLAVRSVLNGLLAGSDYARSGRGVAANIGKSIHHELLLSLFSEEAPELFYTLVNDLDRKMSKSERYKMVIFRMKMRDAGVPIPEWGAAGQQQVGMYVMDQLAQLGMLDIEKSNNFSERQRKIKTEVGVKLSPDCLNLIGQIKDMIAETTPYYLPCIEQPKDWVSIMDGGFHTTDMRRMQPFCIKTAGAWQDVSEYDLSTVLKAINTLQRVQWQVNGKMLDTIREIARHFDMDEILSQSEIPAPPKPDWLIGSMDKAMMTPEEQDEFKMWKRAKAEWFTSMKLRGTKYGRFVTATSVADKFRQFPSIYFVYFADFRGRLYAQTTGISPQGSDMQKALLRFSKGEPLDTVEAERWFCIHGANKWGEDKVSLNDRVDWVKRHHDNIMSFAADPVNNRDWKEADSPLQFLAWCFEYAEWQTNPHTFVSRIPIGMDGSCNGLQNFSAMLRDEVGGKATNLVPSALPNDIYQNVADRALLRLRRSSPREIPAEIAGDEDNRKARYFAECANRYRDLWLKHGISRSLVKRSVMTLPYGSTRFSCAEFIRDDYLKQGKAPEFAKDEYSAAANFLSHFVWDSISDVVVKAKEAMDYLQASTKLMIKEDSEEIKWIAPSGFPVIQRYFVREVHRIHTKLAGNTKIRLTCDSDSPDKRRHKNGIAPNFIHSHDAAHLALTTVAAGAEGLELAMIHDDYGTHARHAERLYRLIREVFVNMYESSNPLEDLANAYDLPAPPEKGMLDLKQVLASPYFFS